MNKIILISIILSFSQLPDLFCQNNNVDANDKVEHVSEHSGFEDDSTYFISTKNNKYGVVNEKGKEVVPFIYNSLSSYGGKIDGQINDASYKISIVNDVVETISYYEIDNFYVSIGDSNKKGLLDLGFVEIWPEVYDTIYTVMDNLALEEKPLIVAKGNDKIELFESDFIAIEVKGKLKRALPKKGELSADHIQDGSGYLIVTDENGQYAYNYNTNEKLSTHFDAILFNRNSLESVVIEKNGKKGFYTEKLEEILPVEYDDFEKIDYGFIKTTRSGLYGILSPEGEIILEAEYSKFENIYSRFFLLEKDGKKGLVKLNTNSIVIEAEYDDITLDYSTTNLVLIKDGLKGIVNKQGKVILEPKYTDIKFENGIMIVRDSLNYGLVSSLGENVTPLEYQAIFNFGNSYGVAKDNLFGAIDLKGNEILPAIYNKIEKRQSMPLAPFIATTNDHDSVFDNNGKLLMENHSYDKIKYASRTHLLLIKDDKEGLAYFDGSVIIEPKYDDIIIASYNRNDDRILLSLNNKMGLYSPKFEELISLEYDMVEYAFPDFFSLKNDDLIGLADYDGDIIIAPAEYKEIKAAFGGNIFPCLTNNNTYVMHDSTGKILSELEYDSVKRIDKNRVEVALNGKQLFFTNEWVEINE